MLLFDLMSTRLTADIEEMSFIMWSKHLNERPAFRRSMFLVGPSRRTAASSLQPAQIHLIEMQKRLMAWSFLSMLLFCVLDIVPQMTPVEHWGSILLQVGEIAIVVVLFLQLSLIVLISCCNLTAPTRH